ncbi:Ribosomal protein L11 methyltransferase [Eubacterium plexicaudatum ASF492]|uniref:Ribosomal protein L11 methyltransferase n=1 Tax=Eubacterium plexicaudatum ASF492 TaxID=1235802 RepID=N2BI33_9FIRM|nr:Ribosomal protein L11 methyltransferase [Eubacterium plexicaudatum ASF492]
MKWDKYTIATTTAAEEVIAAMLAELGIEGVEIENHVPLTEQEAGDMFIDFPPELPPDDGTSKVSFYLDADQDARELLAQVRAALEEEKQYLDIGSAAITKEQTEDVDWMNNWKQFFQSFTIDNILIKPTWENLKTDDKEKILIEIDPGISFGTGKHETTQLCIRQMQKYMRQAEGMCVLDAGCGSGILSIVALKLGAAHVTGIDVDENCIVSSKENMQVNHLGDSLWNFYCGNLIEDEAMRRREGNGSYDLITANILADVIVPMAPYLYPCLKKGGILITSGIIDFKEQEVRKALEDAGFTVLETNVDGEWVNLTAQK